MAIGGPRRWRARRWTSQRRRCREGRREASAGLAAVPDVESQSGWRGLSSEHSLFPTPARGCAGTGPRVGRGEGCVSLTVCVARCFSWSKPCACRGAARLSLLIRRDVRRRPGDSGLSPTPCICCMLQTLCRVCVLSGESREAATRRRDLLAYVCLFLCVPVSPLVVYICVSPFVGCSPSSATSTTKKRISVITASASGRVCSLCGTGERKRAPGQKR